jgi:PAS domain S-box-containing protein
MNKHAISESTYLTIFEACQEGILVVDNEGCIVITNQSLRSMFGYTEQELTSVPVETLIPSRYTNRHVSHRDQYMENPTPRRMGHGRDLVGLRKDKSEFPVEASLNTVYLNGKKHTVAYIIDITARKEMEDALKHSEDQLVAYATELEKRVKDRTEQYLKANEELEDEMKVRKHAEVEALKALERERELNDLKSRFVSMASHEFRTPLSTIKSSAALIEKYEEIGQADKRLRHVGKIKNSIDHLNDILDDFLSLASLEEGRINTSFDLVDLSMIFGEVKEELESIMKPGQEIHFTMSGSKEIVTEPKVIKNVLINLLSNAIKYSPENSPIKVTIEEMGKHYRLHVKDKGMGIPEEEQSDLFQRFFRAKNAQNIQGTGLGLHIVQKYIDLLDGIITFESVENKGTTFIVTIPKITL